MIFSFGSNRRRQKRRRGDRINTIRSEEELARELDSRCVSPFTDVNEGHTSFWELCTGLDWLILFVLPGVFLFFHIFFFWDIYAVQLSRITGNYAETEATVVSSSSRAVKHTCDTGKHNCSESVSIVHSVNAVADDGTEFHFSGEWIDHGKGSRIWVKYSKSNPVFSYVDAGFWPMLGDRYPGLLLLLPFAFFARLSFLLMYPWFISNRMSKKAAARGLYLPVREIDNYEEKTESEPNEYAPVYRYAMPDGTELLFQGMWSRTKPRGAVANDHADFRVYMLDPEDPENNEYFIEKIPRQVKTCRIKSEEELARELASRGVSPFTEVRNSHISIRFPYFHLFLAAFFLILYILIDSPKAAFLLLLFAAVVMMTFLEFSKNRDSLRWNRKCQTVVARGLYLPVLATYSYEESITRRDVYDGCDYDRVRYAPVFRYAMPDGTELRFQGLWSRNKPKGELANHHTEFRVYMMDPEDFNDNRYFIKEIPRKSKADSVV